MAAYERLERLGKDAFTQIINDLMRGVPAQTLAKELQAAGHLKDVKQKTLTQQLNRLRGHAAEGMFGKVIAAEVVKLGTPVIPALQGVNISVLERLEESAEWLRERTRALAIKEKIMPIPKRNMLNATTAAFETYTAHLQAIQKIRFELGLDEYHGVVLSARGAAVTVSKPDGLTVRTEVTEVIQNTQKIFERRGIAPRGPHL